MRKIISATLLAVASSTAYAADLPSRRAPPVYIPPAPPPVFSWSGVYVGGQVGYDFGNVRSTALATGSPVGLASNSVSQNGVIGGGHIGYNYATRPMPFFGNGSAISAVFGFEGDVDGTSAKANYALGAINVSSSPNVQGSVRGRVGLAVDRVLFYATGGAAFGGFQNNYFNTLNGLNDSFSHTRVGYTVGGGIEYAFTNNLSVRAEYRFTDFGRTYDTLNNSTGGAVTVRQREIDNRVQLGVSYKFDMFAPAPVVARY